MNRCTAFLVLVKCVLICLSLYGCAREGRLNKPSLSADRVPAGPASHLDVREVLAIDTIPPISTFHIPIVSCGHTYEPGDSFTIKQHCIYAPILQWARDSSHLHLLQDRALQDSVYIASRYSVGVFLAIADAWSIWLPTSKRHTGLLFVSQDSILAYALDEDSVHVRVSRCSITREDSLLERFEHSLTSYETDADDGGPMQVVLKVVTPGFKQGVVFTYLPFGDEAGYPIGKGMKRESTTNLIINRFLECSGTR